MLTSERQEDRAILSVEAMLTMKEASSKQKAAKDGDVYQLRRFLLLYDDK
jgi:hypothetical protein